MFFAWLRAYFRFGLIVSFLSITAVSSVLVLNQVQKEPKSTVNRTENDPDFYLEDFVQITTDLNGHQKHRLSGQYLAHLPVTDTHELTRPYLQMFSPDRPPWYIRSQRGWVAPDRDEILLKDDVIIWRNAELGQRTLDVRTSELRVIVSREYADTDQPVVLRNRRGVSYGTGMHAFMENERIELLSNVTTIHNKNESSLNLSNN